MLVYLLAILIAVISLLSYFHMVPAVEPMVPAVEPMVPAVEHFQDADPCAGLTNDTNATQIPVACIQKLLRDEGCGTKGGIYPPDDPNWKGWYRSAPNGNQVVYCDNGAHAWPNCGAGNFGVVKADIHAWATMFDDVHVKGCMGPQCRVAMTPLNADGGGNAVYLDRQDVRCNADESLTRFHLVRNPQGTQYQYQYVCCKNQGPAGPAGPIGPSGKDGVAGPSGVPGVAGSAGRDGKDGVAGPAGKDGVMGPMGPAGKDGVMGPMGPAGKDGAMGQMGPMGPAGVTPSQPAPVDMTTTPDQASLLASLQQMVRNELQTA
jgi:hypothetical protein